MRLLILERITHRYSGWRWKQKTKNILYCTSGVDFCQRFAKVVTARSTSFNFCLSKCHHNDQHDITIAQWATCSSKTTIKIFLKMIFNIIGSHCNIICEYCTSYSKMKFKKKNYIHIQLLIVLQMRTMNQMFMYFELHCIIFEQNKEPGSSEATTLFSSVCFHSPLFSQIKTSYLAPSLKTVSSEIKRLCKSSRRHLAILIPYTRWNGMITAEVIIKGLNRDSLSTRSWEDTSRQMGTISPFVSVAHTIKVVGHCSR